MVVISTRRPFGHCSEAATRRTIKVWSALWRSPHTYTTFTAMSSTYKELSTTFEEKLTDIENSLVFSPSFKLRPTVFADDEVARAALLIPLPRLIRRRSPLSLSNGHCQELLLGSFEEAAINGESSTDEEEEQDPAPAKRRARHTKSTTVSTIESAPKEVRTRTHQDAFLASLQPTPAALQKNGSDKKRFDDDKRLAWLKGEKYIKAGTIQPYSMICECCSEELSTEVPKAKKSGRKGTADGKKNGLYALSVWISHRKRCPIIYQKWIGKTGRTDETWSFRG
ncbi:hypothetical protein BDZ89DRAFT_1118740 [Hymenopellis radicata]|nr:hypothetical protein BDZ89DRAFT_1118740 [Hymenopellis radicata]